MIATLRVLPAVGGGVAPALRGGAACLLLSCALFGCGPKKSDDKTPKPSPSAEKKPELKNGLSAEQQKQVLAKVGDTVITLGDFADRLAAQSPYLRARYASPERRREFLDNMVRFELLALEAKKRGETERPEVERVRRQMMVQQMMKDMFDDNGVKLSDVSEAEIKTYYDAHPTEFHKPAQRRASQILYKDRGKAEAALKKLAAAGDEIDPFQKLAQSESQDAESKPRNGDLRFFGREPEPGESGPPKAVREAVFNLDKIGALTPAPIQSEQGFHVVKYTAERPALERSLEDVRRMIQNRLWREKREAAIEAFVAQLRSKADVKENLDALAQVKVNTSDKGPADADGKSDESPAQRAPKRELKAEPKPEPKKDAK